MMLGATIGSYLATIVIRWPRGEPARGRSRCDQCGRPLAARDLVPLLSYALAGGRCRSCGGGIDRRHPIIELLALAIGGLSLAVAPGIEGIAGAGCGLILLALAALDLEHFWLPDRLTAALALVAVAGAARGIAPPPLDRLAGGAAGFLALTAIAAAYRALRGREGLGAGDAKLFGTIGLWLGWRALPPVLLLASMAGIVALVAIRATGRPVTAATRIPLGALLAFAGWAIWLARAAGFGPAG